MWIKDQGDECPKCLGLVEKFTVKDDREGSGFEHEYEDAERCPSCRWQINYGAGDDGPQVVPFGSAVPQC